MMDFIFVPLVVGVVTLGIYKFFELLVCRRERRMIIDKMDGNALIDYLKFVPMGVRIGAPVSVRPVSGGVSGTLKAGCLLLGIGFGLLFAFMLLNWCAYDASYEMRSIVYGVGSLLRRCRTDRFVCRRAQYRRQGVQITQPFRMEKGVSRFWGILLWFCRGPCGAPGAERFAEGHAAHRGQDSLPRGAVVGRDGRGGTVCRSPDACRLPAGRPYSIGRIRTSVTPSNSRARRSMSVFSSTSP